MPSPSLLPQGGAQCGCEALPVSAQQVQACFAGASLAHTPFLCLVYVPSPTPPPGCTWVPRRRNRGLLVQGMGSLVVDRCPEFPLEKLKAGCVSGSGTHFRFIIVSYDNVSQS